MSETPLFDELISKLLPREEKTEQKIPRVKLPDTVESYADFVPEGAREEVLAQADRYAAHQQKIETMVRQGTPRHVAELRELGSPAIYFEGKIVGVEPKDEQPSVEAIVRSETRPKPNPAGKPGIRRLPGYDKRPEK